MQRIFETITIGDPHVEAHLNAIKFFCDPEEKTPAHITVSGPQSVLTGGFGAENELSDCDISVLGAAHFFDKKCIQNTVFLNCGFEKLRAYWKKKDYGVNPHITLYDGSERKFARNLLEFLKSEKLFFKIENGGLDYLTTTKGQFAFDLILLLNVELIEKITGIDSPIYIKSLSPDRRLIHIREIVASLKSHLQS